MCGEGKENNEESKRRVLSVALSSASGGAVTSRFPAPGTPTPHSQQQVRPADPLLANENSKNDDVYRCSIACSL